MSDRCWWVPNECSWIVCRYSWILGGCTLSAPVEQQSRCNAMTKTNAKTNPDHGQQQKQRERSAGPRAAQGQRYSCAALALLMGCPAAAAQRKGSARKRCPGQRKGSARKRCPCVAHFLRQFCFCVALALQVPFTFPAPALHPQNN